VISILSSISLF